MKEFSNVEISIYSFPGFFIYFVQRFSTKQIICRYLHEINANPSGNKWVCVIENGVKCAAFKISDLQILFLI